jgi:hypothetical protein
MQRMWRRLFAALAGVLAVAGMASAQNPIQYQPVPVQATPAIAKVAGSPVIPAAGAMVIRGGGGCTNCGSAPAPAAAYPQNAAYGPIDRNGCGGPRSDAGFIFGGCKSFFDPCGPNPCGRVRGCHGGGCPAHPLASPYGTRFSGCAYDSYLNH